MAIKRRIKRQETKYTKATKKYKSKTGLAPYTAFTMNSKAGKKVRRINRRLGNLYGKI